MTLDKILIRLSLIGIVAMIFIIIFISIFTYLYDSDAAKSENGSCKVIEKQHGDIHTSVYKCGEGTYRCFFPEYSSSGIYCMQIK